MALALPAAGPARDRVREVVEIEIDHRRGEQRQHLADHEPADHGIAERLADFGAGAGAEHQRHAAEQCRHRRHHDRAEAQDRGLADRFLRRQMLVALGDDGEVDHHDAVLLDDADQQNDSDQGNQAEIESERHQDRERADAGRRQRRENGQRVDVALIEDAEDQIDHDQCGEDQQRHGAERLLERLRGALEARAQRRRRAHRGHRGLHRAGRLSERDALTEVEADRHRGKLALVGDGERPHRHVGPFAEHRQRHLLAGRGERT